MIQLSECDEWRIILHNLWFISSNMDALQKFPLSTLKGRDCPGANKKLSLRHVQNSLRGGKSLGVKENFTNGYG